MHNFAKIRKATIAAARDSAMRASEEYCVFLAGPFIQVDEPATHKDNAASGASKLRYFLYHELTALGFSVYLGEDVELRTVGEKHYGSFGNAVVHERHYITHHVDATIVLPSSPGSFCEIGDWAWVKPICEDMIIIIDKRYEGKNNYINDGIVKLASNNHAKIEYISYRKKSEVLESVKKFLEMIAQKMRMEKLYAPR